MTLLTRSEDVAAFCERAAQDAFITIDTEFLRESTYWPKLCLIQLGRREEAVAIDPLVDGIDLTPVWELLRNQSVLKVFHACKQDMELFLKVMGDLPQPIFDTQVAAMMLGLGEQVGYDNLIQKVLSRQVDKAAQFSDWSLRPLEPKQITYAIGDVTHLYEAYEILVAQLEEKGRVAWVEEEMAPYGQESLYRVDPEAAWERLKIKNRSKPVLAALKCLARWREGFAQERDLPRGRVLKDDTLVDIAMRRPDSPQAMMKLRGVGEGLAKGRTGQAILRAIEEAANLPEDQIPNVAPRPDNVPGAAAKSELLRTLLKICGERASISPRALANSAELDLLSRGKLDELRCLQGWRAELFGHQALDLIAGKIWLGLNEGELATFSPQEVADTAQ